MKKAVSVILIVLILINLITVKSYADPADTETTSTTTTTEATGTTEATTTTTTTESTGTTETTGTDESVPLYDRDELEGLLPNPADYLNRLETHTATVTDVNGNKSNPISTTGTTHLGSAVFAILSHVFGAIPQVVNQALEIALETIGGENWKDLKHFTIYDTVMGKYEIFNISYNVIPDKIDDQSQVPLYDLLKMRVVDYYFILRNLSIAIILFILIYIGIRMAISTLASDRAKYKKMLQAWATSLILVFVMYLIIIVISAVQGTVLKKIRNFEDKMQITDTLMVSDIESQIFTNASKLYGEANGWNLVASIFTMWILVFYQLKFFLMYMRRLIEIGFLIMISPLVTVTYSIDKLGDGKAQAFKAWFTELTMKATIQIVHAILYLIFIGSAGYIATQHPLLAALFFAFLSRSEKIIKNTLNVKNNEFEQVKVPFTNG